MTQVLTSSLKTKEKKVGMHVKESCIFFLKKAIIMKNSIYVVKGIAVFALPVITAHK